MKLLKVVAICFAFALVNSSSTKPKCQLLVKDMRDFQAICKLHYDPESTASSAAKSCVANIESSNQSAEKMLEAYKDKNSTMVQKSKEFLFEKLAELEDQERFKELEEKSEDLKLPRPSEIKNIFNVLEVAKTTSVEVLIESDYYESFAKISYNETDDEILCNVSDLLAEGALRNMFQAFQEIFTCTTGKSDFVYQCESLVKIEATLRRNFQHNREIKALANEIAESVSGFVNTTQSKNVTLGHLDDYRNLVESLKKKKVDAEKSIVALKKSTHEKKIKVVANLIRNKKHLKLAQSSVLDLLSINDKAFLEVLSTAYECDKKNLDNVYKFTKSLNSSKRLSTFSQVMMKCHNLNEPIMLKVASMIRDKKFIRSVYESWVDKKKNESIVNFVANVKKYKKDFNVTFFIEVLYNKSAENLKSPMEFISKFDPANKPLKTLLFKLVKDNKHADKVFETFGDEIRRNNTKNAKEFFQFFDGQIIDHKSFIKAAYKNDLKNYQNLMNFLTNFPSVKLRESFYNQLNGKGHLAALMKTFAQQIKNKNLNGFQEFARTFHDVKPDFSKLFDELHTANSFKMISEFIEKVNNANLRLEYYWIKDLKLRRTSYDDFFMFAFWLRKRIESTSSSKLNDARDKLPSDVKEIVFKSFKLKSNADKYLFNSAEFKTIPIGDGKNVQLFNTKIKKSLFAAKSGVTSYVEHGNDVNGFYLWKFVKIQNSERFLIKNIGTDEFLSSDEQSICLESGKRTCKNELRPMLYKTSGHLGQEWKIKTSFFG